MNAKLADAVTFASGLGFGVFIFCFNMLFPHVAPIRHTLKLIKHLKIAYADRLPVVTSQPFVATVPNPVPVPEPVAAIPSVATNRAVAAANQASTPKPTTAAAPVPAGPENMLAFALPEPQTNASSTGPAAQTAFDPPIPANILETADGTLETLKPVPGTRHPTSETRLATRSATPNTQQTTPDDSWFGLAMPTNDAILVWVDAPENPTSESELFAPDVDSVNDWVGLFSYAWDSMSQPEDKSIASPTDSAHTNKPAKPGEEQSDFKAAPETPSSEKAEDVDLFGAGFNGDDLMRLYGIEPEKQIVR